MVLQTSRDPFALTNSTNATTNRIVEDVVAERLHEEMQDISRIDNPASENQTGSNEREAMQGSGELARNLEFLLIKVAQLEAVAEMQQARLEEQTKKIVSQEDRIQSLEKKVNGEDQQSAGAFVETEHGDAETRLNEATDVLKRVMLKHNRQRQNGMLHERHRGRLKGSLSEAEEAEAARWGSRMHGTGRAGKLATSCSKATSLPKTRRTGSRRIRSTPRSPSGFSARASRTLVPAAPAPIFPASGLLTRAG